MIKKILMDAPEPWSLGFQESASPIMTGIDNLHDGILYYIIIIFWLVTWMLGYIVIKYKKNKIQYKYENHGTLIELIWTITPALILLMIAFPSFRLLYLMDEVIDPEITVKVTGHQWYWGALTNREEKGERISKAHWKEYNL